MKAILAPSQTTAFIITPLLTLDGICDGIEFDISAIRQYLNLPIQMVGMEDSIDGRTEKKWDEVGSVLQLRKLNWST